MARVEAGETMKFVAAALGVARSSVSKWAARKARTGNMAPGKMGGHNPGVLSITVADFLEVGSLCGRLVGASPT